MPQNPTIPSASLDPIRKDTFGFDEARHLLWRAGFGGTPKQILTLVEWGPEKSVDYLLDFHDEGNFPDPKANTFDGSIMREFTADERDAYFRAQRAQDENTLARFRREIQDRQRRDRVQVREMQKWWLTRMIETPHPLEEKMTLFWHGHFATSYRTIENSYHMYLQNQLFRAHAVGNFGELLFAIIRDPAMLRYLDNNLNIRGRPNENLARELMELFSLGVGNYKERDIKEGARALTGYTYDGNAFAYYPARHDDKSKSILGKSGNMDGDDFVRAILAKRVCSEFITKKLYRFFAGEIPNLRTPAGQVVKRVVMRLASTMREHRYEIKPVLRQLLLSQHFYDPNIVLSRIKSPVELVVGTIRGLGTPTRDLSALLDAMNLMGQYLLLPPSVKGWEGERTWINTSTLYVRSNVANYLVMGQAPIFDEPGDEVYDPMGLLENLKFGAQHDPEQVAHRLLKLALGSRIAPERQWVIKDFLEQKGKIEPDSVRQAVSLITAMPEYQVC